MGPLAAKVAPHGQPAGRSESGRILVAFALFLALFQAAGCTKRSNAPLRLGINAWPGYEFLYLAEHQGFFAETGVAVRIVEYNSLSDALRAYERGQLDGFGCTIVELTLARAESTRRARAFYVTDYSDGADVILAREGIRTVADLRGRKVGVELGSLGVYFLSRALEEAGLQWSDIEPVSSDQISMEWQFLEGKLDAVVTYPPTSMKLARKGNSVTIYTSSRLPGEIVDVLAIDDSVLRSRMADVRRVRAAFERAVAFSRQSPDLAYAIMGRREGLSGKEFKESIDTGLHLPGPQEQWPLLGPDGVVARALPRVERLLLETGAIERPADVSTASTTEALADP